MSTPYGGDDPNQGWAAPGQGAGPGDPTLPPPPSYPPPGQPSGYPPPDGYGQPDYSQVQPNYGQPYGQLPMQLAGFWIRFGGALIDGIIVSIAQQVLMSIVGDAAGQLLGLALGAAYFIYFHSTTGQTMGNLLVKIKVIDQTSGGTIDAGRAFLRWIVSLLSAIPVGLGYLWMLWDPNKQTWHDKAAKSVVVKVT